jgi:anaphase-promoting complex subunit 6
MDKRTLAIDCYILSLMKSVYQTEALDALLQHEMLNPEQEKQLLDYIMPTEKKNDEGDLKLLKYLYESRLKSYYKAPVR